MGGLIPKRNVYNNNDNNNNNNNRHTDRQLVRKGDTNKQNTE